MRNRVHIFYDVAIINIEYIENEFAIINYIYIARVPILMQ